MKNYISFSMLIIIQLIFSACNFPPETAQPEIKKNTIDEAAETAAIMKVIDGETDCFFRGDYKCWATHWSHENYAFQGWNNSDGTADAAVGWDKINAQGKNWIETYYKNGERVIHPEVRRDKPLVKFFNENSAYLVWKQYNADSEKTYFITSQETRIMEKEQDGWKIVNVTALWDTQSRIPFDSLQIK